MRGLEEQDSWLGFPLCNPSPVVFNPGTSRELKVKPLEEQIVAHLSVLRYFLIWISIYARNSID
jgi:hypothetical protein